SAVLGDDIHDAPREPSLQELDQRTDLARALTLDALSRRVGQGRDRDLDRVELGAADKGRDPARLNREVYDGSVAYIHTAARKAVGEVAVRLEVLAPSFAPERLGDQAAVDADRQHDKSLFAQLFQLALALA